MRTTTSASAVLLKASAPAKTNPINRLKTITRSPFSYCPVAEISNNRLRINPLPSRDREEAVFAAGC